MATVRFTIPDEFLAELEKDQRLVQRGIVRITHLYRDSTFSPIIRHLSVVVTTCIGDDVVRCECDCGDLWQMADNDKKVTARAAQIRRELVKGCARRTRSRSLAEEVYSWSNAIGVRDLCCSP